MEAVMETNGAFCDAEIYEMSGENPFGSEDRPHLPMSAVCHLHPEIAASLSTIERGVLEGRIDQKWLKTFAKVTGFLLSMISSAVIAVAVWLFVEGIEVRQKVAVNTVKLGELCDKVEKHEQILQRLQGHHPKDLTE